MEDIQVRLHAFLIYYYNEIHKFLKPFTDYGMGYNDISIYCLKDNLIEIHDYAKKLPNKIKLTKESFFNITKEWHVLQNKFGIDKAFDLKKLKISYFNNTINFKYELDPERIKYNNQQISNIILIHPIIYMNSIQNINRINNY